MSFTWVNWQGFNEISSTNRTETALDVILSGTN